MKIRKWYAPKNGLFGNYNYCFSFFKGRLNINVLFLIFFSIVLIPVVSKYSGVDFSWFIFVPILVIFILHLLKIRKFYETKR